MLASLFAGSALPPKPTPVGVGAVADSGGDAGGEAGANTDPIQARRSLVELSVGFLAASLVVVMTRDEIAKKAQDLKDEINATGTPLSMAGGIKLLNQCKRVMADMCVLIRELASK